MKNKFAKLFTRPARGGWAPGVGDEVIGKFGADYCQGKVVAVGGRFAAVKFWRRARGGTAYTFHAATRQFGFDELRAAPRSRRELAAAGENSKE